MALPVSDYISQGSNEKVMHRSIKKQMGSGYVQARPDGLNSKVSTWSIQYENITLAQVITIKSFLDGKGAWGIITWTPFAESAEKKFMLEEGYSVSPTSGGTYNLQFTMKQVF